MKLILKKLLRDESGTSAIEMGLICTLIVLAMLTALQNFAGESQLTWSNVSSTTHDAIAGATAG